MAPLHLRVFLSSPGDVAEERRMAMEVLAALRAMNSVQMTGRLYFFSHVTWRLKYSGQV